MRYMTTAEIREKYLNYFQEKGCKLVPSSSLIPDDPSLLLTSAGMVQFKPYFLQQKQLEAPYIGTTSVQKCVRTNDIDIIGTTGRHLSFFEMLGNFSFGAYFKEEMCAWAYDFSVNVLGLPPERLYFTVFEDDDETIEIWKNLGVPEDHISRLGEDDNFWRAGPTGPCGPCSEIYYDQGPEFGCGSPDCAPGCDCDRFLEYWNCVFTQYDGQEDGTLAPLPKKNIDTGMGLERMAAIMQHKTANYDGDLMQHLIKLGEKISGKTYDADDYSGASRSLRIIADHSRAVDFMISDGILPGNEGREYVLRRLLRRAVFHGRLLGIEGAFLTKFIDEVNAQMGEAYPELLKNVALVKGIVASEEERFSTTLDNGRVYLDEALAALAEGAVLPGDVAFKLHDTFGFPIDLTVEIAGTAGHDVDMDGFTACMEDQKARARANAKGDAWGSFNDVWVELSDKVAATEFDGYDNDVIEGAKVVAIVRNGESVESAAAGEDVEVVLDRTPFYAEMGGQQGDAGELSAEGVSLTVSDTKNHNGLYAHVAHVAEGTLTVGATVTAALDAERRGFLRRNHTATHLLDAALKQVLGEHVSQAGSLVTPEHLRFDFTHFEGITPEQLAAVDAFVNDAVLEGIPVVTEVLPIEEAKKKGAVAMFGEKYGDVVRVVEMGNVSMEFCGGTHLDNTAKVGLFRIKSEGSVASGVRRIEAITGKQTLAEIRRNQERIVRVAQMLKTTQAELESKLEAQIGELKDIKAKLEKFKEEASLGEARSFLTAAKTVGSLKVITAQRDGMDPNAMRKLGDFLRDKEPKIVGVLASVKDGKVTLLAVCGKEAVASGIKAGDIIKAIAPICGGKGGGKPDSAMGGGTEVSKVDDALAAVDDLILSKLG